MIVTKKPKEEEALHYFTLNGVRPSEKKEAIALAASAPIISRREDISVRTLPAHDAPDRLLQEKRFMAVPGVKMVQEMGGVYPDSTQRHCQWDRWPFEGPPCGLPVRKLTTKDTTIYFCVRFFCCLECASAFYHKEYTLDPTLYRESGSLLNELHRKLLEHLGVPYRPLEDALDWNVLDRVGSGDMSIVAFRESRRTMYVKRPSVVLHMASEVYDKVSTGKKD